jgi:hypothetical protein
MYRSLLLSTSASVKSVKADWLRVSAGLYLPYKRVTAVTAGHRSDESSGPREIAPRGPLWSFG